ncbi:MAG TPA: hypothetical protein VE993_18305 [Stellaceae bacterium]|nr:hypothetical protein [Stellaceae bacterium]
MKRLSMALGLAAALLVADSRRPAQAFVFVPGVTVDAARGLAFVMEPANGIAAIDLDSGAAIAATTRAVKPLIVADGLLLAEAEPRERHHVLPLVGLSARDLTVRWTAALPLPDDLVAAVDQRSGASFNVVARHDADGLLVEWRALRWRVSAIPTQEAAHLSEGFARIDPSKGRILASGRGKTPGQGVATVPADIQALVDRQSLVSRLCRTGGLFAALARDPRGIVLLCWRAADGRPLAKQQLFLRHLTFRDFSADCRDLLASHAEQGWIWSIFATATGKRVARLRLPLPGAPFFVRGERLYYAATATARQTAGRIRIETPPRVVAVDLVDGRELWAQPIRETAYLGPYPRAAP